MDKFLNRIRIQNPYIRAGLAEFLGTCILIVFGDGSVAQKVLSRGATGSMLSVNWAWCMAVTFGVLCSINVSGGHINPAVSVAMSVIGRLPWKVLPIYLIAQYLGAFTGAAIVYLVYFEAIADFDHGRRITLPTHPNATAGIFATYPQPYLTAGEGIADQIVATALLLIAVLAVIDKRNANVPLYLVPLFVGFSVFAIGASYGQNCGYAINPARDLGPRIFTAMAGWGNTVFSNHNWFWVPILGPHIGAIIGAITYLLLIENHWENNDPELSPPDHFVKSQGTTNSSYLPEPSEPNENSKLLPPIARAEQ